MKGPVRARAERLASAMKTRVAAPSFRVALRLVKLTFEVELRVQHFGSETRLGLETGEVDLWVLPEFRAASMYSCELLIEDRLCLVGCAERHRETQLTDARDLEKATENRPGGEISCHDSWAG